MCWAEETVLWELLIYLVNMKEKGKEVFISGNHVFCVIHSQTLIAVMRSSPYQDVQLCGRQDMLVVKIIL